MKAQFSVRCFAFFLSTFFAALPAFAQSTAFTYQGQLKNGGSPANGSFTMTFKLYDALSGGTQQGSTLSFDGMAGDPAQVSVTSGLFTVSLDFGVSPYAANTNRWLEIAVGGVTLTPRQPLSPAPFALNTRGLNVDATGRIGVGVTPTAKFQIGGTAGVDGVKFPDGTTQVTAATGGTGFWSASGANIYNNNAGSVGIGTSTPHHRLSLIGGPAWTSYFWTGAVEFGNSSAIGWQANAGGQRFGIGQSTGGLFFFRTSSDPGTTGSPPNYDLTLTDAGNFGIGVTNPVSKLEIAAQDAITITGYQPLITLKDSNNANRRIRFQNVDGNYLNIFTEPSFASGIPSVQIRSDGINIAGQNALVATGYQPLFTLSDSNAGYAQVRIQGVGGEFVFWTQAGLNSGIPPMRILNTNVTEVKQLRILGGADLAEPFDVAGDDVQPGMVVSIDPAHPGQLKPCTHAYDRKVAGIVSGAGGVCAGLSMGHEGTIADGKHPIALTGRVYCLADASNGAIEPGDMLTTSGMPGHAMKAADFDKARGAIIGKAMTSLANGKGLVLVLVNLQ